MNINPQSSPSQASLQQKHNHTFTTSSSSDSMSDYTLSPDFETAYASERFFFSSPGHSNSIIDSATTNNSSSSSRFKLMDTLIAYRSIAVATYSQDPMVDFRRSMQQMVEARELHDVHEDWDYLRELLMCYLMLNPKSTRKFIVKAYVDLVVNLMNSRPEKE